MDNQQHASGSWAVVFVIAAACVLISPPARADGLLTGFVGYNFGGNAGTCPVPSTTCSATQVAYGGALGFMVKGAIGLEEDIAYTPKFFGQASGQGSNYVLTAMTNLIVGVPAGGARPYVSGGVGLIHTNVNSSTSAIFSALANNSFGFNVGGGLMGFFSNHAGIRGDVRYLRSFQSLTFSDYNLSDAHVNFWRVYGGVVFRF